MTSKSGSVYAQQIGTKPILRSYLACADKDLQHKKRDFLDFYSQAVYRSA